MHCFIPTTGCRRAARPRKNDPESAMSRRTLPLPDRLAAVLKAPKARQAADRLALGRHGGAWTYVVSNEIGEPYSPAVLSRYWRNTVTAAVRQVPVAVIAACIGHKTRV